MINKYQICSPHICNWASFNQLPPHASCKYKRIYIHPKGLGAESARAVTGRRCPHSGEGEDFLTRRPSFFYEYGLTRKRKVEKLIPRWEMNRLSEGYEQAVDKIWCPNMHIWQNMTIWALQIWSSGVSVKRSCKM